MRSARKSRTDHPKVVTDKSVNMIPVLLNKDRYLTLQELEMIMNDSLGDPLSQMLISHIVTEKLGLCKMCAQWVPYWLSPEYITNRMAAALNFLERYERDGEEMLSRIVTEDETWVHHFTPSTKKKFDSLKRTQRTVVEKFKTVLSANKVICTVFWETKGVIWQE